MSASKAKGTKWESKIVSSLQAAGFVHVERRALNGATDKGDILGIAGLVIEAKDQSRISLAEWIDEAEAERRNAGAKYAVVWHHRRGRADPLDAYVTMAGRDFVALLQELRGVPS